MNYIDEEELDEVLDKLRTWDKFDNAGLKEALELVRATWAYPDYVRIRGDYYYFATGGWSDNEAIIYAIKENIVLWMLLWIMSSAGGGYVFVSDRKEVLSMNSNPFFRWISDEEKEQDV